MSSFFDDDFLADAPPGSLGSRVANGNVQSAAQTNAPTAPSGPSAPPPAPPAAPTPPAAPAPPAPPTGPAGPTSDTGNVSAKLGLVPTGSGSSGAPTGGGAGHQGGHIFTTQQEWDGVAGSDQEGPDAYRARMGNGPRPTPNDRVVNGRWVTDRDDTNGLTIDEMNAKISAWDAGYRKATGQVWNPATNSWGLSDRQKAKEAANAAAAGGGGAGGAGGSGGGGGAAGSPGNFDDDITAILKNGLAGTNSRYNPAVVASMRASAAEDAAGQTQALNRAAQRSAARKGNLYSGSTDAEVAANARAGSQVEQTAFRKIDTDKATADFEDKMANVDRALQLVEQQRTERMANAKNAVDIRRIEAEAQSARDSLSVQREKIQQDAQIAQQGYDAERASGRANRDWQDSRDALKRQQDLEDQRREDAYRLAQLGLAAGG